MTEITNEILEERKRQNAKWGVQRHNWAEWLSILTEEVGEAATDANKARWANDDETAERHVMQLRTELIQTAAVAVQIIEHLDEVIEANGITAPAVEPPPIPAMPPHKSTNERLYALENTMRGMMGVLSSIVDDTETGPGRLDAVEDLVAKLWSDAPAAPPQDDATNVGAYDEQHDRLATSLLALEIDGKPISPHVAIQIASQMIEQQIEFCLCPARGYTEVQS